jgi:hypothetical protein
MAQSRERDIHKAIVFRCPGNHMAKSASSQLLSDRQVIDKPEPVARGPAALGEQLSFTDEKGRLIAGSSRFAKSY